MLNVLGLKAFVAKWWILATVFATILAVTNVSSYFIGRSHATAGAAKALIKEQAKEMESRDKRAIKNAQNAGKVAEVTTQTAAEVREILGRLEDEIANGNTDCSCNLTDNELRSFQDIYEAYTRGDSLLPKSRD